MLTGLKHPASDTRRRCAAALATIKPASAKAMAALVALLSAGTLHGGTQGLPPPTGLRVVFLDVGQGDSTLLQVATASVLVDEGPEPGGRLLVEGQQDQIVSLLERAREAGVEVLVGASALGFFDGLVPVWQGDTLHQIRAPRHVIATGAIEQPLVFAGNDLPGVMLSDGARRLARR